MIASSRSVNIYIKGPVKAQASTKTRGRGNYRLGGIGRFPDGTYRVLTTVRGSVRSGYGDTHVCLDAYSNVSRVTLGKQ